MTTCFLLERTGGLYPQIIVLGGLRDDEHYHSARVTFDRVEGDSDEHMPDLHDDTLPWPTACDTCGEEFTETKRSAGLLHEWARPDTGETHPRPHDFGPGAMWNADWMPSAMRNDDGVYLVVICPDGSEWHIDGPSSGGGRWSRTGTPPDITVSPSVQTNAGYHGYLKNGSFGPNL